MSSSRIGGGPDSCEVDLTERQRETKQATLQRGFAPWAIEQMRPMQTSNTRDCFGVILLSLLVTGCAEPQQDMVPTNNGRPNSEATRPAAGINDLSADTVETLRQIPGVANVQRWGQADGLHTRKLRTSPSLEKAKALAQNPLAAHGGLSLSPAGGSQAPSR